MTSSRLLLSASAVFLLAVGVPLNFAPAEIAHYFGIDGANAALMFQIAAGALLGFAMINWMSRGNTIGGIYSRPLCMGNLLQFGIGAFALLRAAASAETPLIWIVGGAYLVFALSFGYFMFGPVAVRTQGERG